MFRKRNSSRTSGIANLVDVNALIEQYLGACPLIHPNYFSVYLGLGLGLGLGLWLGLIQ